MLIRRVVRGGFQKLDLGGDKRHRNIVHSEQKYETAQSLLLTVTRLRYFNTRVSSLYNLKCSGVTTVRKS